MNKITLIGRLGKNPEVKTFESGSKVANFTLATSEYYKKKDGEKVTKTEWHNIVLWKGLADVAERFLKKGSQVAIEGKITSRSWDDKDGNKRYMTEIVGSSIEMLGAVSTEPKNDTDIQDAETQTGDDKDLPF